MKYYEASWKNLKEKRGKEGGREKGVAASQSQSRDTPPPGTASLFFLLVSASFFVGWERMQIVGWECGAV